MFLTLFVVWTFYVQQIPLKYECKIATNTNCINEKQTTANKQISKQETVS